MEKKRQKSWQEIADEMERAQAERVEALEKAKKEFLEAAVYSWTIPLVIRLEAGFQRAEVALWRLWRWLSRG